VKDRHDL